MQGCSPCKCSTVAMQGFGYWLSCYQNSTSRWRVCRPAGRLLGLWGMGMPAGWYLVGRLASRSLAALLKREGKASCTALPSLGALGVSNGFPEPMQRQSLTEAYQTCDA